ncbi:MAG: D-alanyl-D-alanine carboxypeptidase family protein [Eubacteriales bacterium]|nr:D-alanyl-D-alanine carboxypeptidase family protein [Eubacteriales bacterium]
MKNKQISLFSSIIIFLIVISLAVGAMFLMSAQKTDEEYTYLSSITPTPSIAPPMLYAEATEALLRMGSISTEVKDLQQKLKDLGFYDGEIDGQFGSATKESVKLFQKQHNLTADGIAGSSTLAMLYGDDAHKIVVTPVPVLPDVANLPVLINRTHPFKEEYTPKDLVEIRSILDEDTIIIKENGEKASKEAVLALGQMIKAAQLQGIKPWQVSEGYRTLEEQQNLFDKRMQQYISGEATGEQLSAEQAEKATSREVAPVGTSEHHSGLAFDITVPGFSFGDTEQAKWLAKNCWEYGFILRYPLGKEDITGFKHEPWHIRYVGKIHSIYMRDADITLEEYISVQEQSGV